MAHNVEKMAYAFDSASKDEAYQHPWHKSLTGTDSVPVHPDMSPAEMLKVAGLDYQVLRKPAFAEIGGEKVYSGVDVLYRDSDNSIMTIAPETWHENQNDSFVEFFSEFCHEGSMEMNTMGSLDGGRRPFAMAKIKKDFSMFRGKDIIESYMLFSNPHKYGKSITISSVMTRVVCENTIIAALREDSSMSVRVSHRKRFDSDEVKSILEINNAHMESYKEVAEFLATKKFSVSELSNYYKELFPAISKKDAGKVSRKAGIVMDALDTQPGAEYGQGTWWQAFNATTYAVDHLFGREDAIRRDRAWFGTDRQKKNDALKLAVEYAEAA